MTKRPTVPDADAELNQLLARGRLSGAEYDAVERRVLDRVAPRGARRTWPLFVPALGLAAGLALWLASRSPGAGYAEKGGGDVSGGVVSLGCGAGGSRSCRLGDTLLFSVLGNVAPVYLVAYAERIDVLEPSRIWYFPHSDASAPRVEAGAGTKVLSEGVKLGPPHVPGRYRVKVWLSASALEREQAAKLSEHAQSFELDVVE